MLSVYHIEVDIKFDISEGDRGPLSKSTKSMMKSSSSCNWAGDSVVNPTYSDVSLIAGPIYKPKQKDTPYIHFSGLL